MRDKKSLEIVSIYLNESSMASQVEGLGVLP